MILRNIRRRPNPLPNNCSPIMGGHRLHTRASVRAQRTKIGNAALKTGFTKFCKLWGLLLEFFPTCHRQSIPAVKSVDGLRMSSQSAPPWSSSTCRCYWGDQSGRILMEPYFALAAQPASAQLLMRFCKWAVALLTEESPLVDSSTPATLSSTVSIIRCCCLSIQTSNRKAPK